MRDTIYREDAIKALRLKYPMMPMFKSLREEWAIKTEGFHKAEEVIMKLPSADRPQGEWKSVKASIYPYGYDVECSVCGHRMGSSFGYKYCPMCGAHMKGADDE